jgi:hypothetical protein
METNEKRPERIGINIQVPSMKPFPKIFPARNRVGMRILTVLLRKELKHGGVLHREDGLLNFELNSCIGVFAVTDWKKALRIVKCALIDVGLLGNANLAYFSECGWKEIYVTSPGFNFNRDFTEAARLKAESAELRRLSARMQKLSEKLIARGKRLKPTEET